MPTPGNSKPTSGTVDSTLYVSCIEISLAKNCRKTIECITLHKNGDKITDVQKTICAGGLHREEFSGLIRTGVEIDINLSDVECMRNEDGGKSYRKRIKDVEIVVTVRQNPLGDLRARILDVCSRFRLLVIGNSGVGKSTLIEKVFGVENVHTSDSTRGRADIDKEFTSVANERFVVHDSLGFEAGDQDNMEIVKQFVSKRTAEPQIQDQLHAIWLCLETPYAGGRLLEDGAEEFLQRRKEFLGDVPLVVVLTKADLLDAQLEIDQPADPKAYKSKYMDKHCINPLLSAAGKDVTYVPVSTQEEYPLTLLHLLKATMDNMEKYHVNAAPRALVTIAQRISIKEKIELSIAIGKQKYWKTLWRSAVLRGRTLKECLQLIRNDIITVWNFNDPERYLTNDKVIGILLADNLGNDGAQSAADSFTAVVGSVLQDLLKQVVPGVDILFPIGGIAFAALKATGETYKEGKHVVETLMTYIVDLICVMQIVFLLSSGSKVTQDTVARALEAYKTPKKVVHEMVKSFDVTLGMQPGGRDVVLEKIEELIWRHSIADGDIHKLRQSIKGQAGQAVPTGSGPS